MKTRLAKNVASALTEMEVEYSAFKGVFEMTGLDLELYPETDLIENVSMILSTNKYGLDISCFAKMSSTIIPSDQLTELVKFISHINIEELTCMDRDCIRAKHLSINCMENAFELNCFAVMKGDTDTNDIEYVIDSVLEEFGLVISDMLKLFEGKTAQDVIFE